MTMVYQAFGLILILCACCAHGSNDQSENVDSRVFGGSTAWKKDFPYMASIRTNLNELICGASVIHPSWILTAAHCVYKKSPSSIVVVVGTHKRKSGGEFYSVSKIIIHNTFNPNSKFGNIALLQTSRPMRLHKYVKPIALAEYTLPDDTKCELTGWGVKRSTSNDLANKLRYVKEYTISVPACKSYLPQYSINDTNVCASRKKGKGGCDRDDGGPLVCKKAQHGILSLYVPCARGFPDVYTSVAFYRSWIRKTAGV